MSAPALAHHDPEEAELVRRVLGLVMAEDDAEEAARAHAGAQLLSVMLYRKGAGGWTYVDTLDPEEFVEGGGPRLVRDRFGGGHYQARLTGAGGKYFKQPVFRVAGPARALLEAPPAREEPADDDRLGRLERMVAQLVERAAAPAPAPTPDFFGAVAEVAKAMQASSTALLVPLLDAITKKEQRADPTDLVDLFVRGMEAGRDRGSAGGFGDVVREMLPQTLNTLRELGGTPAGSSFNQGGRMPTPAAGAPNAAPVVPSGAPVWAQVLGPYMGQLLQLAEYRADPAHWAGEVCERADVEQLTFIDDALQRGPEWREEFFAAFPAAQPRRSWFEMFFDAAAAELEAMRAEGGQGGAIEG